VEAHSEIYWGVNESVSPKWSPGVTTGVNTYLNPYFKFYVVLRWIKGDLAGRPGHVACAEEVEVEVLDGLAAVGAGVDDDAVAVGEVLLAGDFGGGGEELAEERGVGGGGVGERGDVLFGDDEDVDGGLGVDVREGEDVVVLIEASDGDGAGGNLAEEAGGQYRHLRDKGVGLAEQ
jgi:hypothetical protein